MFEMVRLDICMEVSAMSYFFAITREVHFQQLLHMFAYLYIDHNAQIVFYPSYPEIHEEYFKKHDWGDLYINDSDQVPLNAPMPLGS